MKTPPRRAILLGPLLGLLVALALFLTGIFLRNGVTAGALATPLLTVLPMPTTTATRRAAPSMPAATASPTEAATPVPAGFLQSGQLVEINGTEGDGLRLRSAPGLDASVEFLALEAEVFEVRDGPIEADGFEWWRLVNPYNLEKEGWAVGNYLRPIGSP